jgi:hypothetical protein
MMNEDLKGDHLSLAVVNVSVEDWLQTAGRKSCSIHMITKM